jgi:hypothetical protein
MIINDLILLFIKKIVNININDLIIIIYKQIRLFIDLL